MPPCLQLLQVREELLEEAELGRLAVWAGRAGRQVHGDHPQLAEARFHVPALGVELAAGEAPPDLVGRNAAVQRNAAVAFLAREGIAAGKRLEPVQLGVEVGLVALDLLQAHYVRALRGEPAEQPLARR